MHRRSHVLVALLASVVVLGAVPVRASATLQGPGGQWEQAFNRPVSPSAPNFNAVHMALIPVGPNRGKVLMWDYQQVQGQSLWWDIWDPVAGTFASPPPVPAPARDLFCSGHTWTKDGRLVLAGGLDFSTTTQALGSQVVYVYDPHAYPNLPDGVWILQNESLEVRRFYPTNTLGSDSRGRIFVFGGSDRVFGAGKVYQDTYEVFLPGPIGQASQGTFETHGNPPTQLFPGPTHMHGRFEEYPRMHHLSTQHFAMAGMRPQASRALHDPAGNTAWPAIGMAVPAPAVHFYGTSVLFPNLTSQHHDTVMRLGGFLNGQQAMDLVQWAKCSASGPGPWPSGWDWDAGLPPLNHARSYMNAVLLPDAGVAVFGGSSGLMPGDTPVKVPELFLGGVWHELPAETSWRDYHSTALLLPDGRILSAGGENREWDFQVFRPHYMTVGDERVEWQAPLPSATMSYHTPYTANFTAPAGVCVARVVLMRPGSVTHHFCQDQRYVELAIEECDAGSVTFWTPPSAAHAPSGFYMLYLLTDQGIPTATPHWVQLQ